MHRLGVIVAVLLGSLAVAVGDLGAALAQEVIKLGGRRIVGGEKTDISKHPWQVAINAGGLLCGGSIIADRWVLTAAHCFQLSTQPEDAKMKAGITDIAAQGVWAEAEQVITHEDYNPDTYENDIALIRLKKRPAGRIIPLATEANVLSVGQPLEVTGWGTTEEDGQTSDVLRKANVPYVENAVCNAPASYDGRIKEHMLCAGHKEGGIDSCQGDSGGPLVLNSSDGPVLVGVVSWGWGCAQKLNYGVYTRVADYRPWINRVLAANAK